MHPPKRREVNGESLRPIEAGGKQKLNCLTTVGRVPKLSGDGEGEMRQGKDKGWGAEYNGRRGWAGIWKTQKPQENRLKKTADTRKILINQISRTKERRKR